jgi:hypothetical protein
MATGTKAFRDCEKIGWQAKAPNATYVSRNLESGKKLWGRLAPCGGLVTRPKRL